MTNLKTKTTKKRVEDMMKRIPPIVWLVLILVAFIFLIMVIRGKVLQGTNIEVGASEEKIEYVYPDVVPVKVFSSTKSCDIKVAKLNASGAETNDPYYDNELGISSSDLGEEGRTTLSFNFYNSGADVCTQINRVYITHANGASVGNKTTITFDKGDGELSENIDVFQRNGRIVISGLESGVIYMMTLEVAGGGKYITCFHISATGSGFWNWG